MPSRGHINELERTNTIKSCMLKSTSMSCGFTDRVVVVVEPLLVGRLLGDALDHLLELGHRRVLLGVQEHGRLLPADHQEHVHGGGGKFKLRGE